MFTITTNTLVDGRFEFRALSRMKLETPNTVVRQRMKDLAYEHFGEHAIHIKGNDGYGHWAHKQTGQTIELEF